MCACVRACLSSVLGIMGREKLQCHHVRASVPLTIPQEGFVSSLVSDYSKEALAVSSSPGGSGSSAPGLFVLLTHFLHLVLCPELAQPVCRVDLPQ